MSKTAKKKSNSKLLLANINDVELIEILATLFPKENFKDEMWENDFDTYDFIYDKYNIDREEFGQLIASLIPLCSRWKSLLTGIEYSGFVDTKREVALIKREVVEAKK